MSGSKLLGRLPDKDARLVLVSGEYPELAESLRYIGICTITTASYKRLPGPVQWHPDMQACIIGDRVIVLKGGGLHNLLAGYNISAFETARLPKSAYPGDVLCNVLAWDKFILGNSKTADTVVQQAAQNIEATWIDVKQGYAACTVALVDEQSAITADEGVADQLERYGLKVLRIRPGDIRLPGYSYGFIGGCCGKLAPDMMAFTGKLDKHRDGTRIKTFLGDRGVRALELLEGELLDVGGLIALN